jgi:hypothetical protein
MTTLHRKGIRFMITWNFTGIRAFTSSVIAADIRLPFGVKTLIISNELKKLLSFSTGVVFQKDPPRPRLRTMPFGSIAKQIAVAEQRRTIMAALAGMSADGEE